MWYDARTGSTVYLLFVLSFVNFILITYRYLLETDPQTEELFSNLWIFGIIFLVTYIPASILIGFWHRRTQLSVENYIRQKESPFFCKLIRTMLDIKTGKASDEEIEEFRKMLSKIETQVDNQRLK
jgi:uncharacterized protein YneF (UPF0154 family)|tara:strand:+ start:317 stop:694 length:378 start_codon:yes stop_codon:yes gene_type:complete